MFDEKLVEHHCRRYGLQYFDELLQSIEEKACDQLELNGWQYIKTAKRVVVFSVGEIELKRKCYRKDGRYLYPLDQALGLEKYSRYSLYFLMQIAKLSCYMPYRQVVESVRMMKGINITKDTVLKAVKLTQTLYEQRVQYVEEGMKKENTNKRTVPVIYLEGDGIVLKTRDRKEMISKTELAHFVIHEGKVSEYGKRYRLKHKHEILLENNHEAREKVLDYLYQYYHITKETLLITNSDMGKGYSPYAFKEIAKSLGCQHMHYWDKYHLYRSIKYFYRQIDSELKNRLYESIMTRDKKKAECILLVSQQMIEDENQRGVFEKFRQSLLRNFHYTAPVSGQLSDDQAIGIMESQQCKIANRMKNRGMYWSKKGAETIARLIIEISEDTVEELFFGDWKIEYQRIQLIQEKYAEHEIEPRKAKEYFPIHKAPRFIREDRLPRF